SLPVARRVRSVRACRNRWNSPDARRNTMTLLAIPYPVIDPVLIEIGPLAIRWYALSYIGGILFAWWWARRLVARDSLWGPGGSPVGVAAIDDLVVWVALGIILGG